ncbi:MAG: hypothetical protein PVF05_09100 [Gemmatimonadales bacterium]|jgi:hypothetical protein
MTEIARSDEGRIPWRVVGWSAAALILLLPLVAMQFTDEVNWTAGDFAFAALLILAVAVPSELVVRKTGDAAYRAGAGIALATGFLLLWSNGAVGITDSEADLWLALVPAVGVVGAFLARFRPGGMAIAMFVTALTQASIAVATLIMGIVPAFNTPVEILGINGFFVVLFVGSGLLFRNATAGRQLATGD